MADESDRTRLHGDVTTHSRATRAPDAFQEVPGEAEADAVRDAFVQRAGTEPEQVALALGRSDTTTRERVVRRLQRERGNRYVQRVVAAAKGTPGRLVGHSQEEMVQEVQQRKGAGSPLPAGVSGEMTSFFGADVSEVRIHTGGEAAELSRELSAQAFTVGKDIFFAEGKYDPSSTEGKGLIAHELTHVGQQGGLGEAGLQRAESPEEEEDVVQREEVPEEEEESLPA